MQAHTEKEASLVWGADRIATEINRTRRQTFALLEAGHIPARKVGGRWVADREELRAFFKHGNPQAGAA
ncbi:DNA-binding protein [Sinorhizobium numidicum]|uniref:DNA-binding protein n=1 Tax=Sinorhizobium numidicum TaxID=680248 RepID=A0ABY8D172_9HYPH|nr:DNA-binding protein [Sinorhizobium numidicum]WEX77986.1 DNA-binding protein [Sinorhizobium numidicum]WEX84645.1 DNA-binding protein [Sinorhizobium numidicum]